MSEEIPSQPERQLPPPIPNQLPEAVVVPPAVYAEGLEVIDGSEPWVDDQLLPQKPAGVEYGICYKPFRFGPTKEAYYKDDLELLDAIQKYGHRISGVYLPDHSYAVPLRSLNLYSPLSNSDFKRYAFRTLIKRGALALFALSACAILVFLQMKSEPQADTIEPGSPSREAIGAIAFFMIGLLGGILPIFDAFIQWAFYPSKRSPHELKQSLVQGSMFNAWIRSGSARWPIWALALIYLVVYICQHLAPGDYQTVTFRATINPVSIQQSGEWWRLFTATLMHADVLYAMHLLFNTLALVVLGTYVQRMTNASLVPIIFVVCAFGGAILSTIYISCVPYLPFVSDEISNSLGASGGVLGLLGFMFWLVLMRRKRLPYEFRIFVYHNMIRIAILGGCLFFAVDHGGHLGGFIVGLFCGMIYEPFHRGKWSVPWTPVKSILTAASFAVVLFGFACCIDVFYFESKYLIAKLPLIPWPI